MKALMVQRLPSRLILRRIALAYLVVWVLSPPLAHGAVWRVLAAASLLLWVATDLLSPRSVILRPSWPVLGGFAFGFYTLVVELVVPDRGELTAYFQLWILLCFLLIGESFLRDRAADARFCFWLILLILPVWVLRTIWGLDVFGHGIARAVVRSSDEARALAEMGFGGYPLVYASVLCLPFLAQIAFRSRIESDGSVSVWRRRVPRLIILINLLLVSYLVLRAGYTIAVLLATISLASVLLIGARNLAPMVLSVFAVTFVVLVVSVAFEPAIGFLEQATAGTEYSSKFRDIRESMAEGESAGTLEDRTERYMRSVGEFIENPIVGTLSLAETGKHSSILDHFAKYGLGIGMLFLTVLTHVPLRTVRSHQVPIGLAVGFLVVGLVFPLVNNVTMSWGLILFVFSRGALVVMGVAVGHQPREIGPGSASMAHAQVARQV